MKYFNLINNLGMKLLASLLLGIAVLHCAPASTAVVTPPTTNPTTPVPPTTPAVSDIDFSLNH
jgi:hypothetical protein